MVVQQVLAFCMRSATFACTGNHFLKPAKVVGAFCSNAAYSSADQSMKTSSSSSKSNVTASGNKSLSATAQHKEITDSGAQQQKDQMVLQKDAGWFTKIIKGTGNPQHAVGGGSQVGAGDSSGGMPGGAHSALGTKKIVYELQFHKIKPDSVDNYIQSYGRLVDHVKQQQGTTNDDDGSNMQLVGSWLVHTGGDQDQVVNLWKHANGYSAMDSDIKKLNPYQVGTDTEGGRLTRDYSRYLRKRQSQYLLAFSFWGDPTTKVRQGTNLYEVRSYSLRPGTMVEWANHWARAIHIRKKDSAPVGGFFSQVGHMYKVYHVWSYADLEDRRQSRDHAWRYPGWDECVQATVPLIKDMQSRLMYATPFSPLQ